MNFKEKFLHFINPYRSFVTFSKIGNYGRLGNQLFQYAAVRSYALKYNIPIILPQPSKHRLDNFNIKCNYANINLLKSIKKDSFKEKQFHFDPLFFQYSKRIDFNGYFQSEKYFSRYRKILLKDLTLKDNKITEYSKQYITNIRNENYGKPIIALHNRRGDNVPSTKKYSNGELGVFRPDKEAFHPLLSLEYLKHAKSFFNGAVFLIFSDNDKDIIWCKENINGPHHYYSEGHDDLTDFTLMRYCDHNIISNSSFSWWAAWLNEHPKKVVIAPNKWFGDAYKELNLKDLYPKDWIVI